MRSWTFKLPVSAGGRTITVKELSVADKLGIERQFRAKDPATLFEASKRAREACIQEALVAVDGKPVDDDDREAAYYGLGVKGVECLSAAYEQIHSVSQEEVADFLATMAPVKEATASR